MLKFIYPRYLRYQISLVTKIRAVRYRSLFTAVSTVNRLVVPARFSMSTIMSSDLDITRCFEFVKKLTLQAGEMILKYNIESDKGVCSKGEWDYVTIYDQKIEKMFIDGLSKEFPDHKIIAEETVTAKQKMPEMTDAPTWFLDPIDGTTNFIHSFPFSCISIALTVCKELVLGIIYNPLNSELYSAVKGKGAFLNEKPIFTSKVTELKKAMLFFDPSAVKLIRKDKDIFAARGDALIENTQALRSIGTAALSMAYLAQGIGDVLQNEQNLKPWDVAAGILIIREAGGIVMDINGDVYNIMKPNIIVAANETLAQEMVKIIVDVDLKMQRKRLKRKLDARQK